jgi:two-component system response regulator DegU
LRTTQNIPRHLRVRREEGKIEFLTYKQLDILLLLAKGVTRKDIALQLCITKGTVNQHIKNMYAIMHVHTQEDAIAEGIRSGQLVSESC